MNNKNFPPLEPESPLPESLADIPERMQPLEDLPVIEEVTFHQEPLILEAKEEPIPDTPAEEPAPETTVVEEPVFPKAFLSESEIPEESPEEIPFPIT